MEDSNSLTMRVKRGMVFWFDPFPYEKDKNAHSVNLWGKEMSSSVQAGKRPWLVVSADRTNGIGGVCNICPITTVERNGNLSMVHPSFEYRGKTQYVMVEQITTIDLFALREYECFVSDKVMLDVEKAMKLQFGIRETYKNTELVETLRGIESVIESVIKERLEAGSLTPSPQEVEIEDVALRLGELFEELLMAKTEGIENLDTGMQEVEKNELSVVHPISPSIERFNRRYKKFMGRAVELPDTKKSTELIEGQTERHRRNRWTDKLRREYVRDCSTLPPDEIAKKYGLNRASLTQTKYACIKKLGEGKGL